MPIEGGLPPARFNHRVLRRLEALEAQASEEGMDIARDVYNRALLYALMAPPPAGDTLTICATPQATLMLRWLDPAGRQIVAREVKK